MDITIYQVKNKRKRLLLRPEDQRLSRCSLAPFVLEA